MHQYSWKTKLQISASDSNVKRVKKLSEIFHQNTFMTDNLLLWIQNRHSPEIKGIKGRKGKAQSLRQSRRRGTGQGRKGFLGGCSWSNSSWIGWKGVTGVGTGMWVCHPQTHLGWRLHCFGQGVKPGNLAHYEKGPVPALGLVFITQSFLLALMAKKKKKVNAIGVDSWQTRVILPKLIFDLFLENPLLQGNFYFYFNILSLFDLKLK